MTAVAAPTSTGISGLLNDIVAMTRRNLLRLFRTPQVIVFATIQPVIFVLLFNFVFGGSIQFEEGVKYIDFLVPGILVQTSLLPLATPPSGSPTIYRRVRSTASDPYRCITAPCSSAAPTPTLCGPRLP